jgi:2-polyprenyl-3-methyl-5-hydroxy-6-metoxy-1,4-benzoquinol methylase
MITLFRDNPAHRSRAKVLAELAYGKVLDVACGDGYIANLCAKKGLEVIACDIAEKRVEMARCQFGLRAFQADICNLPFADGDFDTVIAGEILEHFDNWRLPMGEIQRVCSPKGQILISLPIGLEWGVDKTHRYEIGGSIIGRSGGAINLEKNYFYFIVLQLKRWDFEDWEKKKH